MQPLTCLFIVQGEGRGHLTQALGLATMLRRNGHRVCGVVVSCDHTDAVPAYFEEEIKVPVAYIASAHFVMDEENLSIHWLRTLIANLGRLNEFASAFAVIRSHLRRHTPDVIISFYEPLGGLFMLLRRPKVPMIAVAHQYMFFHPSYPFPDGFSIQKRSTLLFTRLTALGATRKLALSLYDAPSQDSGKLTVMPPILRKELLNVTSEAAAADPFFLVYLFHHSLSHAVIDWHKRHPDVRIHCYWNNTSAPDTTQYSDTLTFHRLHGQRFYEMMIQCQGMVTTSGFETMAEAMYLSKPLLVNPVRKHFEQYCNAMDGGRMGAAVQTDDFNLSKLVQFVDDYAFDATSFRAWVDQAEEIFVQHIEQVARS